MSLDYNEPSPQTAVSEDADLIKRRKRTRNILIVVTVVSVVFFLAICVVLFYQLRDVN